MQRRAPFNIRPLMFSDLAVIQNRTLWGTPRVIIPDHHCGIGAIAEDGTLAGYGGFRYKPHASNATISAIQSRMPGAGRALLDALKARFDYLRAEDVLASAATWWERRGFVLVDPANDDAEAGGVGTYEWWRDDDPLFADRPYESMWLNHRHLARLVWDG